MSFKEFVAKDLDVIFNLDEFAENINIDGEQIAVVIDNDMLKEYNLKNGGEGLAKGELLFHVPEFSLKLVPFVGKRLRIDNKLFEIIDVKKDLGVYTITLAGYQS